MSPFRIALKGLQSRALSSGIAAVSLALAVCLLLLVWAFKTEAERSFAAADGGFDAVLGPRGSELQIVLNALYHLEESPGLMKWSDYEQIKGHRAIAAAYPIAVGDNYLGIRLVGTVPEYLAEHEYREGEKFVLGEGKVFAPDALQGVAGALAARQLKLKVGDTFNPYHGLQYEAEKRHEETYTLTGILEPTGTPADRVIWIPVNGIQTMSGHSAAAADALSAVLVKMKPGANMAAFQLDRLYNRQGNRLTFAWPASKSVLAFFEKLGWFDVVLQVIAVLVAVIAGAGMTALLYNAMNERRRDIAVWRALGARRGTIMSIAVMESLGITFGGLLLGAVFYIVFGTLLVGFVQEQGGVPLDLFTASPVFLWVPGGVILLGLLAGLAPAVRAYSVDVTRNLS